jgi:hypothetical protein
MHAPPHASNTTYVIDAAIVVVDAHTHARTHTDINIERYIHTCMRTHTNMHNMQVVSVVAANDLTC